MNNNADLWAVANTESPLFSRFLQAGLGGVSVREQLANVVAQSGRERLGSGSLATISNGVAIVPMRGLMLDRMNWSYASYEEVMRDIALAIGDDRVGAILMDVNSPGGMVSQCDECADFIRAAAKKKRLVAHIGAMGASAAYMLSAAAGSVIAGPTAIVGSVGAKIEFMDMKGILERFGAQEVKVVADQSPNKSHPSGSDEQRAELQPIVNEGAEIFIRSLAKHRRVSRATVIEKYGQGSIFPASQALERGMIDGVQSLTATIQGLMQDAAKTAASGARAVAVASETPVLSGADDAAAPVVGACAGAGADVIQQLASEIENANAIAEVDDSHEEIPEQVAEETVGEAPAETSQSQVEASTADDEPTLEEIPMSDTIKTLIKRRNAIVARRKKLLDDADKRADKKLLANEREEIKAMDKEIAEAEEDIKIRQSGIEMDLGFGQSAGRRTEVTASQPRTEDGIKWAANLGTGPRDKNWQAADNVGYTPSLDGLGEMALDLIRFKASGNKSERLTTLTALGHEGEKGGFFLPQSLAKPMKTALVGQMSLLEFCDTDDNIDSYSFEVPVDDDQDWDEARGPQARAAAEGATTDYSDISLDRRSLQLGKVQVKVKVTDELMKTVSTLARWLNNKASRKMAFKISNYIARGTGVNQPLGFFNSAALVTVAAEGSQTADTICAENIVKMIAANSSAEEAFENLLFLMHPELVPHANLLASKATSEILGIANMNTEVRPGRNLFGVPYRTHQICNRAGDLGDIFLLDLKQYYAPIFRGGIEMRVSEDAGFDDDTTRIKFTIHLGGVPYLNAPIASRDGSFVQSPFCTLAAR